MDCKWSESCCSFTQSLKATTNYHLLLSILAKLAVIDTSCMGVWCLCANNCAKKWSYSCENTGDNVEVEAGGGDGERVRHWRIEFPRSSHHPIFHCLVPSSSNMKIWNKPILVSSKLFERRSVPEILSASTAQVQTFYRCSTVGEFSESEACCSEMTRVSPDPTLTVLKQEVRECGPRNIFLHLTAV